MTHPQDESRTMGTVATAALAAIAMVLSGGALIVAFSASDGADDAEPAAAVADDEDAEATPDDAPGAPAEVEVALSEFALSPAAIDVSVGGSLLVTNDGAADHDLAVRDADIGTAMLGGGESETLSIVELDPGTYEVYCTVPGHDSAGMTATLNVLDVGNAPPGDAGDDGEAAGDHDDHAAHDVADEDWDALDAAMEETILAFPAETEGKGNQLLEPEVLDDGTKVFRLEAGIFDWELEPGNIVEAWGYNGQVPGPEIRVDVGDRVRVEVDNELPMGTDVHWHGVRVPNDQDGVAPITQDLIAPGESFTYEFVADEPAIGMYHPHHHGQMKLPNGMFGAFIIGDVGEDIPFPTGTVGGREIPEDIEIAQEIPMVLNDAGAIGLSLNGKSFPATEPIVAEEDEWIVIHYYNEGLQIHPMHLHQMPQLVFAKDGFPLDAPQWEDTVNVAPGERYSVLVHASDPGVWVLHCHILTHAERHEGMFGMVTALIVEES